MLLADARTLAQELAAMRHDPLAFVLFAFRWGHGELASHTGPRAWQREELRNLGERLRAYSFGDRTDDVDHRTGMPIPNPSDIDAAGNMKPYRCRNKEFSTRVIERKIVQRSWAIARDNGAGNPALSSYRLLTNHTQRGEASMKGERRFRDKDDHDVDARRQVALRIVGELRRTSGFVAPSMALVSASGRRSGYSDQYGTTVTRADVVGMSPVSAGRGSVFGGDW